MAFLSVAISCFLVCVTRSSSALILDGAGPRVVEYNLTIGYFVAAPDGVPVNVLGINGQLPSPTLSVTQGDTLVVNVVNQDPVHGHSLHWHGLTMRGSPEMDGVVGVTQRSLHPFQEMQYRFTVEDEPGTYWYHSHSGLNKVGARGIAGMLVVHAREGEDVHENLYTEEAALFLQDWSHEPPHEHYLKSRCGLHPPIAQSANAHNVALYPWTAGLINGIGDNENGNYSIISLDSNPDEPPGARLRMVNGGENFALHVSVDNHQLLVISTDGVDTEPLLVDSVIVHLGERYDAVLMPNYDHAFMKGEGNHWIRARTLENDEGSQVPMEHEVQAVLRYAGAPDVLPTTSGSTNVILNCFDVSIPSLRPGSKCLPVTALVTHHSRQHKYNNLATGDPDETHEIAFEHSRGSKYYGHFTRVRSNVHETDRLLSHRSGDYTQFVLPGQPTIYEPSSTHEPLDHEHTLHLDLQHGNSVQIIWNHRSRTAHPIHIHGYKFIVAATHEADVFNGCSIVDCPGEKDWFRWPLDKSVVDETIRTGKFLVKDTAVLPAGGYLVTRLNADNPGHWVAHCHTDFHLADGMGVILREGSQRIDKPVDFPSCSGADFQAYDPGAMAARRPACQCLNDPEAVLHAAPESTWKCSTDALCHHTLVTKAGGSPFVAHEQIGGKRIRGVPHGRNWLKYITTIVLSVLLLAAICAILKYAKPRIPKVSNNMKDMEGRLSNYNQVCILIRLVLCYEWNKYMKPLMVAQVVGLALVGGLVYFNAGYDTGERAFREKIAFGFWQCAFWSVSTIYSSIVTYHYKDWKAISGTMVWIQSIPESSTSNRESTDRTVVAIGLGTYHIAKFLVCLLLASPWPILFALITDSLSQLAPTIQGAIATGFVLLLTQQAFDGMGCFLAEVSGPGSTSRAVCLGTITSQLLVIAGGFYRTVPVFISAISPIRYSFAAISKLTFSSSDSFWCIPERAMAWRGYTWCSTEQSGAITDLKIRGLNVVDSSSPPRVWTDILALMAIIAFFRCGCYVMACFNMRKYASNNKTIRRIRRFCSVRDFEGNSINNKSSTEPRISKPSGEDESPAAESEYDRFLRILEPRDEQPASTATPPAKISADVAISRPRGFGGFPSAQVSLAHNQWAMNAGASEARDPGAFRVSHPSLDGAACEDEEEICKEQEEVGVKGDPIPRSTVRPAKRRRRGSLRSVEGDGGDASLHCRSDSNHSIPVTLLGIMTLEA